MMDINFYQFKVKGKEYNTPHKGQLRILASDKRFRVVCCGRRFGKTIFAVNTLLEQALYHSNHTYWYVAPTFRQAKTIAWRYLITRINMLPLAFRKNIKINSTELSLEFKNGSVLEFKGVERPDNLLGTGLDGVVLDEYATDVFGSYPIWKEVIRPSLSDKGGWAIIISTPRGYNHFHDLYTYAQDSGDEDWEAFHMPSSMNPLMTKKELKAALKQSGEDLFSQEYLAEFKKRSGLVYKDFSRELHVVKFDESILSNRWTLEIGIDFGANHPTAILFLLFSPDDTAYVVDEHYEVGTDSETHISAAKAKEDKWLSLIKQYRPRVRWGDNQAKQTILDWNKVGYYVSPVVKGKDSVEHGISIVNSRLRKDLVTGKPSLYIDRRCMNTIREFENYAYITGSKGDVEEDDMMRMAAKRKDAPRKVFDDAMDALRYVLSHHVQAGSFGIKKSTQRERDPLTGM